MSKDQKWTGVWTQGITDLSLGGESIEDQSIRVVVPITYSGEQFRIRLSNRFGDTSVYIGAAYAAVGHENINLVT